MKSTKMKNFSSCIFYVLLILVGCSYSFAQNFSGGYFHSLFLCNDGTVMACGNNEYGQLGDGTIINKSYPIQVAGLSNVTAVEAGGFHSIFIKSDGTVWTCGFNTNGQLGDATDISSTIPIHVPTLTDIVAVEAGREHSLFLGNDGLVWACGLNNYGQNGNGTNITSLIDPPIQVSGLTNVIAIAAGGDHSLFLKDDGTVWACGWNIAGQLGNGTYSDMLIPTQINSLTNVVAISAGDQHSLFLKDDGTVWACGDNFKGQLGIGSTTEQPIPVQINSLSGVVSVVAGGRHSIYLKNDGTIWACGHNDYGQIGSAGGAFSTSPIQLNALTNVAAFSSGFSHSFFLKKNQTLWSMGGNSYGELGDGTTTNTSAPVQTNNLCPISLFKVKGVFGYIYNDVNNNCIKDFEAGLTNRYAIINPGNRVVQTNSAGYWYLDSMPVGNYTITVDTSGNWSPTCATTQSFSVVNSDTITNANDFGFVSKTPCAIPDVTLNIPYIRRGFSDQKIHVRICNAYSANAKIISGFVDVALDEFFTFDHSSISYTNVGNNTYRFPHGDINPGECSSFNVSATVSLDAIFGQTICAEAKMVAIDSCVLDTIPANNTGEVSPCLLPWDKSNIKIKGECKNENILFTIYNTANLGEGDMQCYSPVRFYIDGEYLYLDSVLIAGGDSVVYTASGDGRTWRIEVDQHRLHPGNSNPNATVELCGNQDNWTPDLVNMLPMDDADPVVDIFCGIVTGSYDPNDKTGYPLGIGTKHKILPNGDMEYLIRFQNTGTDTAFKVVVRDTLDTDFDIFTVQSGVSSHAYEFDIYGTRVLQWTFNNILLPDSTTNQEGSNGFVMFKVKQNSDLADGTELTNKVGIYFDFNDPVVTNTTSHIVDRGVKTKPNYIGKNISVTNCEEVSINGIIYKNSGSYTQLLDGDPNQDTLLTVEATILSNSFSQTLVSNCNEYVWTDGITYDASGTYTQIYLNVAGCDSVATLELVLLENSTSTTNISACESFAWTDGNTYTESGTYSQLLTNAAGCDSIATLDLVILESTGSTINVSACESFAWTDGNTYTESGTYSQLLTNTLGCDSVAILEFVKLETTSSDSYVSSCDEFLWTDGITYTSAGIYEQLLTNRSGCDSIATLHLTINLSSLNSLSITSCDAYNWTDGNTYTNSGLYHQLFTSSAGCDSVLALNLTVNNSTTSTTVVESCNEYLWSDGNIYTVSGSYFQTLVNSRGCDSIAALVLTVGLDTSLTISGTTLSSSTVADTYQWLDCSDSYAYINGANSAVFLPQESGIYALELTQDVCTDTSSCYYVYINSSRDVNNELFLIVKPNPTTGKFTLLSSNNMDGASVKIYTPLGEVVYFSIYHTTQNSELDLSKVASGVYFLRIENGDYQQFVRVVKE